jgi:3-hydroxybutyrate dehydrogenase
VRTPLVDRQIAAQAKAHGLPEQQVIEEIMLKPMPKRAFVTLEELGGIVEFLASDVARNVTGQWIAVDGGWTCQ